MKKIFPFLLIGLISFQQCKKNEPKPKDENEILASNSSVEKPDGLQYADILCYICHSPNASETERTAPPMIAIKAHYLQSGMSREEFINAVVSYAQNPTEEKAKLPGAVAKFGLMPKQPVPTEELRMIAEYLYDYKIEEPTWFAKHYEEKFGKAFVQEGIEWSSTKKSPKDLAISYAMETKELLGRNLQKKLKMEGAEGALEFCNIKAIPLTKEVADKYHVGIKRVSDQPRNPDNKANDTEKKYIELYKAQVLKKQQPKPEVVEGNLYVPIVTNTMCLQCHGEKGKGIQPEVAAKLAELYPKDEATGYKENQIRGLFVVELPK